MAASFSFNLDPGYGVPLDEYLDSNQPFVLAKYPVDRVLSAIQTITTNDPPEAISDATLEAVLSVAYYPEHLVLLDVEFCSPLYEILGIYLDEHGLLEMSFGVLLMQVHGIFTMVELLGIHDKLSGVVEQLASSQTRGVDAFHRLSREVVQITGLDQNSSMPTVARFYRNLLPSLQGRHSRSFLITCALLECIFEARAEFSRVYTRVPGFGWPLVLVKIWPRIQLGRNKSEEPYKKVEELGWLRDLANRCLLVAPSYERCVAEALTEVDCTGGNLFVEDPFEEPKDLEDLKAVACTLIRQLSTRSVENAAGGLKHLNIMSEYTLQLTREMGRYDIYPQIIQTAYTRLWTEFTSSPSERYPVDDMASYGIKLLRQTCDGCMTAGMLSGLGSATVDIARSLSKVDFFNLIGRLFLQYTSGANETETDIIVADEFIGEIRNNISMLGIPIARHTKSLSSAFKPYHSDWLKVLRYITQLQSMSLPSSRPLLPHLEELISDWKILGEAVGYADHNYVVLPCFYDRCPGFEVVNCRLACGKCLNATYCSARCQQADWMYGDNPHHERCSEHIGGTNHIEGST